MPYIKELNIHGFKSFARETKVPFKQSMNVIVGPNGSGKSNITDAICFVLGRLASKSMRAKKLGNLIFAGTDKYKPSGEASVEMIFDNTDKGFSLDNKDISIKRILRRNGQSIYKINDEVRTRQEVLELLGQAGIDPNGFNIILQGEIDSFVKMPPDKRREVIEEVAGISVYEIRKKRSLSELDKTEQKLKEVNAILRERTAYLKNLEQERKQALRFKKLQEEVVSYKASIAHKQIQEKQEKIEEVEKEINTRQRKAQEISSVIEKTNHEISLLNEKINNITENIQKQSGLEQEKLNTEISDLRADLAGLTIRKQNTETQLTELKARKQEVGESINNLEREIKELSGAKPKQAGVKQNIEEKKKRLEEIDENRRKLYILKSQLSVLTTRVSDKQRQIQKTKNESEFILKRIEQEESEIQIKDSLEKHQEAIVRLKAEIEKNEGEFEISKDLVNTKEKVIAVSERQLQELAKIKAEVSSLDICPLCKTKITKEHVHKVIEEADEKEQGYTSEINNSKEAIEKLSKKLSALSESIKEDKHELAKRSKDVLRLELINEKKQTLRKLEQESKDFELELADLEEKREKQEKDTINIRTSEENYDSLRLELQELERQDEKNVGLEATMKQRELERRKNIIKQALREIEELESEDGELEEEMNEKQDLLHEKNDQDEDLKKRFRKTLEEKNSHHEKIRFFESDIMHKQNDKQKLEQDINELKIYRAQYDAQKQAIEQESKEYKEGQIIRSPVEVLKKKLEETQAIINSIGTVNMRALEVYEDVKKEYDKVQEKSDVLIKEREEILKVIEDIDKKKRKVFLQTLKEINVLFSRNFSQLSSKGIATLEPADEENIFEAGIEMLIKVGKGKYFDTHSLSGGEKSLISLSLIFAIQEYKPYCFYIFDEIDAALDRRNSERLANLLKRYMKQGQYIIITHNDSLITEAPIIYGVSMQDKISKVVSLEV